MVVVASISVRVFKKNTLLSDTGSRNTGTQAIQVHAVRARDTILAGGLTSVPFSSAGLIVMYNIFL